MTTGQIQSDHSGAFYFGLKFDLQAAGVANQNNYGQNEMDYTFNPGIGAGVALMYDLNLQNSFQLEISFQSGGQSYDDRFKGRHFKKDVHYSLLSVPLLYKHRVTKIPGGYTGVGIKPIWYILGGLQLDRILSPEIDWYIDDAEVEFIAFTLEGGNPNEAQIQNMGAPSSDEELFTQWDGMLITGGGLELHLSEQTYISLELRGGIGLTDINDESWRLKNNKGIYQASRLAFLGLHVGIHTQLSHP